MTLIQSKYLQDYKITVNEYHHKSGLKIIKIIPQDIQGKIIENTFMIQFKTPSIPEIANSGVQHIIEHSVLCGSKNFNLKEPFTSLMQSQITNYLNAGTYTEHTEYPASSRNIQSYKTLMSVYLDAVFNPNILHDELIFAQEGHHKMVQENNQVIETGVVLNEMKGDLSDILSKGSDYVKRNLFEGYPMGANSGGLPQEIVKLTYQQFKDYYETHYTPDNAVVVLYSSLPIEEEIKIIEQYLPERHGKDIQIEKKQKTNETKTFDMEEKGDDDQSALFAGHILYDLDIVTKEEYILQLIVDQLIHDSPNSYFKKEFQGDFNSMLDTTEIQPYIITTLSGSDIQSSKEFQEKMTKIYKKLGSEEDNYINKEALRSSLLQLQNDLREDKKDQGIYYAHKVLQDYLFNNQNAFKFADLQTTVQDLLNDNQIVQKAKNIVNNCYLSGIYLYLHQNPQLEDKQDEQKEYTEEELKQIKEFDQKVKARQAQQDDSQELKKLETLHKNDLENIHQEILNLQVEEFVINNQRVITYPSQEQGITNVQMTFDISENLTIKQLQILSTYCQLLGEIRTKNLQLDELEQQVQQTFIKFDVNLAPKEDQQSHTTKVYLSVSERFTDSNLEKAYDLTKEILYQSMQALTNEELQKQLIKKINELHDDLQGYYGYQIASGRCQAYYQGSGNVQELTQGVSYLRYLESKEITVQQLQDIIQIIQQAPMLLAICTSDKQIQNKTINLYSEKRKNLFDRTKGYQNEIKSEKYNSVSISGDVNYVAQCIYQPQISGNPANMLVDTILYNKYLWDNIRVDGGAYGCFVSTSFDNMISIVSYRDPNIKKTINTYKSIGQWIQNINFSESDLLKFKIGAISKRQKPLITKKKFEYAITYYLENIDIQKYAQQVHDIINVENDDMRKLASIYNQLIDQPVFVCGNENKMKEDGFTTIDKL